MKKLRSFSIVLTVVAMSALSGMSASAAPPPEPKEKSLLDAYVSQGKDLQVREQALKSGKPAPLGKKIDQASVARLLRSKAPAPRRQAYTAQTRKTVAANGTASYTLTDPLTNPITLTECANSAQSAQPTGWIKHHFAWCERWSFDVVVRDPGTALPLGKLSGEVAVIATGASGTSAQARFDWRFTALHAEGIVQSNPDGYGIETRFYAIPTHAGVPSACGADRWVGRRAPVADWFEDSTTYWWTYGDATGAGNDHVSSCRFVPYFKMYDVDDPDGGVSVAPWFRDSDAYANGNALRCDLANYIKYGSGNRSAGCLFQSVSPYVPFSFSNTQHLEATQHIYDALYYPIDRTYPKLINKTIPGLYATAEYLHRNYYNSALRSASSTRARQECNKWWPNYSSQGKDCDEFPFNSTYEGAGKGDNRFSARAITLSHNRSAGSWLSLWYYYDRILDNDFFQVAVGQ